MDAALNAWEYILECSICDDPDTAALPHCAQWPAGVVRLRRAVIYMAPSILVIYDQLAMLEDNLPCYDYRVVPAIVRQLDRFIDDFADAGVESVIKAKTAALFAQRVKVDLSGA